MKIDRLIGILSILLQQEKVTAPILAEKFEVSRRTINRDVEDICKAGIPLVTRQGQNGGISIMEGYKLDRTLLTSSDMQAVLAGLRSLDSVSQSSRYKQIMEKLSLESNTVPGLNSHLQINLSSWHKSSLSFKIELIQNAIDKKEKISFLYYSPNGESNREIEPYLLTFQWSSWYVWGFCTEREDYRLFKLNRLEELKNTTVKFEARNHSGYTAQPEAIYPAEIEAVVIIDPSMKWRLVEEAGIENFQEEPDGRMKFRYGFHDKESMFSWLLSFGNWVELLEPIELRHQFYTLLKEMTHKYEVREKNN